jgi:hypothetical protein
MLDSVNQHAGVVRSEDDPAPGIRKYHWDDILNDWWLLTGCFTEKMRPTFCSQVARLVFRRRLKHWLKHFVSVYWNLHCGVCPFFPCLSNVPTWCGLPLLLARTRLWVTKFHRPPGGYPDPWQSTGICPMACAVLPLELRGQKLQKLPIDQCSMWLLPLEIQCKFVPIIVPLTVARNQ